MRKGRRSAPFRLSAWRPLRRLLPPYLGMQHIGQSLYEDAYGEFPADQCGFVRAALGVE